MDEIYQKIEQSDYDYLWNEDPYIVNLQNINEINTDIPNIKIF